MSDDPRQDSEVDEAIPDRSLEALQQAEEKALDAAFKKLFGRFGPVVSLAIGISCIALFIFSLYKLLFTELSDDLFARYMIIIILVFPPGIILAPIKIFDKKTSV